MSDTLQMPVEDSWGLNARSRAEMLR